MMKLVAINNSHESLVAQSFLTLCDPMDCNPPDSSVHGILQTRNFLEKQVTLGLDHYIYEMIWGHLLLILSDCK